MYLFVFGTETLPLEEIDYIDDNTGINFPSSMLTFSEVALRIQVIGPEAQPLQNIEVGLWTAAADVFASFPDAGVKSSDSEGRVSFAVPPGEYTIGFIFSSVPEEFLSPEDFPLSLTVRQDETTETVIQFRSSTP